MRARLLRVLRVVEMAGVGRSVFKKHTNVCRFYTILNTVAQRFESTGRLSARRSLLYIPGNDEKKIRKAANLKADVVVLDCEDGVALNRKVSGEE